MRLPGRVFGAPGSQKRSASPLLRCCEGVARRGFLRKITIEKNPWEPFHVSLGFAKEDSDGSQGRLLHWSRGPEGCGAVENSAFWSCASGEAGLSVAGSSKGPGRHGICEKPSTTTLAATCTSTTTITGNPSARDR